MAKYELLVGQLLHEGTIEQKNLYDPGLVEEEKILEIHDEAYWNAVTQLDLESRHVRRIGFPLNKQLVQRSRASVNGTVHAGEKALNRGISFNSAGGTHHAYRGKGEGFCVLNDIAVSASNLFSKKLIKNALVIDLDVHQGNGTAKIFESDDRVFTFSMHGADNYPLKKEKSDLDIPLKAGTTDDHYLATLEYQLSSTLDKIPADIIFFQAGVDVLASDKLGKLSLSKNGCLERDKMIFMFAFQKGIPIAVSMGGGYSEKLTDIVDAHCNTYRVAFDLYD